MAVGSTSVTRRILGAGLLSIALYYAVWDGEYSSLDLWRISRQQRAQEARLAETRLLADSLAAVADRLENDDATIEAVARERFGLIRPGETLYRFVEIGAPSEAVEAPGPP